MTALALLIGAACLLLSLGAAGRVSPRVVAPLRAPLQAGLCLVGVAAALFAPGAAVIEAGATFGVDGLSSVVLAALFLLGACGSAGPVATGMAGLAVLAGDAAGLVVFTAAACCTVRGRRPKGMAVGSVAVGGLAVGGLAFGALLLAWHGGLPDPRFAAMRALPPGGVAGGLALAGVLVAAAALPAAMPCLPGAILSLYVVARLLPDLAGGSTPGWWGVPVLVLGCAAAMLMARRSAAAGDLAQAVSTGLQAILGLAVAGVGVALLARGADLPSLAGLGMTACFLLLLTAALWGGLALLAVDAIQASCGTTALARLGGLLRRVPVTGLALLIALLSLAAVPPSTGFAAFWMVLQALLGAARLGGTVTLALCAGAVAALGLVVALLGGSALRLMGVALLGTARSAKAAAATEPPMAARVGMGALAGLVLVAGLVPSGLVALAQPAIRQLTGGAAEGAGLSGLAVTADTPGYAVVGVAALLGMCTALAGWAGRGTGGGEGGGAAGRAGVIAPVWRGGLAEDGPARANTHALLLWPDWRTWRPAWSARLVLAALALGLAAALGWAAR